MLNPVRYGEERVQRNLLETPESPDAKRKDTP
jgi:hypothetical protein